MGWGAKPPVAPPLTTLYLVMENDMMHLFPCLVNVNNGNNRVIGFTNLRGKNNVQVIHVEDNDW